MKIIPLDRALLEIFCVFQFKSFNSIHWKSKDALLLLWIFDLSFTMIFIRCVSEIVIKSKWSSYNNNNNNNNNNHDYFLEL